MYQAVLLLFLGVVFPTHSPTPEGKAFGFWAGGHIVYFECILLVNLVLLRHSHNMTGWGELLIFLQVTSYFWLVYLDSILMVQGDIAYFSEEFYSSRTAWLGCLLLALLVYVEQGAYYVCCIIKGCFKVRSNCKTEIKETSLLENSPSDLEVS